MIHYKQGDVYLNKETDIIFNPVGVRDNNKGFKIRVRHLYPDSYNKYHEQVWMYNERELLGDIQVARISAKRVMLNGFCIDKKGHINKLALAKTLVELCNLAYEYKLSIGIQYALGAKEPEERKWISRIIKEAFRGVDIDIYIYDINKKD